MKNSPPFENLSSWLAWMEKLHPSEIDLGLDRILGVARRLDLLNPRAKIITVAGTNGKGSFIACLEHLLKNKKKHLGVYTSPHLLRYNERIKINGEEVSDDSICRAFEVVNQARGKVSLTYFEFATLAAFYLFKQYDLDYWLLEIGLGGRLDAVNILDPDVAVITSIDLDHQSWLGDTREKIGLEKAGILRPGVELVCAEPNLPETVIERIAELAVTSHQIGRDFTLEVCAREWHFSANLRAKSKASSDLEAEVHLQFGAPNLPPPSVAAAIQTMRLIEGEVSENTLRDLSEIELAGRYQRVIIGENTECILDVAHNPAAASLLASRVAREKTQALCEVIVVVAMMKDKAIKETLLPLIPLVDHWFVAEIVDNLRCASASELARILRELNVVENKLAQVSGVEKALHTVLSQGQIGMSKQTPSKQAPSKQVPKQLKLLVFGSFYTVSIALNNLSLLKKHKG